MFGCFFILLYIYNLIAFATHKYIHKIKHVCPAAGFVYFPPVSYLPTADHCGTNIINFEFSPFFVPLDSLNGWVEGGYFN
jgi:hypothetical protein